MLKKLNWEFTVTKCDHIRELCNVSHFKIQPHAGKITGFYCLIVYFDDFSKVINLINLPKLSLFV